MFRCVPTQRNIRVPHGCTQRKHPKKPIFSSQYLFLYSTCVIQTFTICLEVIELQFARILPLNNAFCMSLPWLKFVTLNLDFVSMDDQKSLKIYNHMKVNIWSSNISVLYDLCLFSRTLKISEFGLSRFLCSEMIKTISKSFYLI